jgi:hypothetical protein
MEKDQLIKYVTDRKDADYMYGGENYVIDIKDMIQLINGRILNFDVNMEYGCTLELSEDLRKILSSCFCVMINKLASGGDNK